MTMSLMDVFAGRKKEAAAPLSGAERVAKLRRVITENTPDGRSRIALDGPPDPVLEFIPGAGLFEIWTDPGSGTFANLPGPASLLPPHGGVKCRWFTVLPVPPAVTAEELAAFYDGSFAAMSSTNLRPDTARHPGMHTTETLDFIIVIEGQVKLILDDGERLLGPGDVVVQRATNHAWSCVGDVPALLVAVLIDKSEGRHG